MRSDLVFAARRTLGNRYVLCHATAKASRKFHISTTRFQDTLNGVLTRIAGSDSESITLVASSNLRSTGEVRCPHTGKAR